MAYGLTARERSDEKKAEPSLAGEPTGFTAEQPQWPSCVIEVVSL